RREVRAARGAQGQVRPRQPLPGQPEHQTEPHDRRAGARLSGAPVSAPLRRVILAVGAGYGARRSSTVPSGPTATTVGTIATPYLRARSGRSRTSRVTSGVALARSLVSQRRHSEHNGCVNSTYARSWAARSESPANRSAGSRRVWC